MKIFNQISKFVPIALQCTVFSKIFKTNFSQTSSMMQNMCNSCNGKLVPVKARIRERIGCPSNCSGVVLEKTVGQKCSKCGKYFQSDLVKRF